MLKNMEIFCLVFLSFFCAVLMVKTEMGVTNLIATLDVNYNLLMLMTSLILFVITLKISEQTFSSVMIASVLVMYIMFSIIFFMNNFLSFYIFFEMSVVPLMFLVSYWGYSLERVKAMFYMFLYTFTFSFPIFLVLMYTSSWSNINILADIKSFTPNSSLVSVMCMGMLLVKMPMWMLHLWLMKAHVEASTEGSMVLASVVLKLSGIAMIKLLFFIPNNNVQLGATLATSIAIVGALIMSLYTLRQMDLKLIVAVSSVIHMSFMLVLFVTGSAFSLETLLLVMLAHGLVSPLMFLFLGLLYEEMSTRNIFLVKGAIKKMYFISIVWFLLCTFNMALPLSMNFIAEIFFFFSTMSYSLICVATCSILIFVNGLFNIYLYASVSMGTNKNSFSTTLSVPCYFFYFYSTINIVIMLTFMKM